MKLAVEAVLPAPRERVFEALTDPEILRRSITGCEELATVEQDVFRARLKIGLAAVSGTYTGSASIRDRRPPESLTVSFDGKGTPGFVRGVASIHLSVDADRTLVHCEADVQVGGVISAVGSRLIGAAARKLADDFFARLAGELQSRPEPPSA